MKILTNTVLTVCNTVAGAWVDGLNMVAGAWNEMGLKDGEREWDGEFSRYGEYPVTIIENGQKKDVIQVVDREAAEQMASNFATLRSKVANFFKGIPVYEGHADDPDWRKQNPGYKPRALGRIKEIRAGEDAIEVRTVFNERGANMLSGEAPDYCGHSARWRMREIPDRPGYYRPFLLWSDALTNDPNISSSFMALNESPSAEPGGPDESENATNENNDINMNPELLKRLGLKPEATQTEIDAKVASMLDKYDKAKTEKSTAESNLTAANTRADGLKTKLDALQGTAVATAINEAVDAGRITEADKPTWENILKADFDSGSKALAGQKAADALNTQNHLGDQSKRKGEGAPEGSSVTAMNAAAHAFAKANGIDVSNEAGWTKAWEGAKSEKPAVFGVSTD